MAGTSPADLDFALRVNGQSADVYEANALKASSPVGSGDLLRISVSAGTVTYSRNAAVFYSSQRAPIFPMHVRVVLLDRMAEIGRVYLARTR